MKRRVVEVERKMCSQVSILVQEVEGLVLVEYDHFVDMNTQFNCINNI
jgi:hypothetical protein